MHSYTRIEGPATAGLFCKIWKGIIAMRKSLILVFVLFANTLVAQKTLILGDDAHEITTAGLYSCVPCGYDNANFVAHPDFLASAWTKNGAPSLVRSLIKFDLSQLPANATILSARLDLYHYNSLINSGHSQLSGPNLAKLLPVTAAWDSTAVTWNNQPGTTLQNAIDLPTTLNDSVHVLNIDLTILVKNWFAKPQSNHGMLIQLDLESPYRAMLFASSRNPIATKRPRLTIVYVEEDEPPLLDSLQIMIPNVFTPNEDGTSDTYRIEAMNIASYQISIFNRWGSLLFHANQPEDSWAGTYNGKAVSDGVYFAVINVVDLFGVEKTFYTTVHLMR